MSAIVINSSDIAEFGNLPNPQSVGHGTDRISSRDFSTHYHPKVGAISFKNLMFPHMHVMEMGWKMENSIELSSTDPSDNININFHLTGDLQTRFPALNRELRMQPGRHNLVFSPEGGYRNRFARHRPVEMFHISLDKQFFINAIGCDDAWSEKIQNDLVHLRPLAGAKESPCTTHEMFTLINQIRRCSENGPMRNLMVQSKVLELLALQMQQFRGNERVEPLVRHDEAEKLHQLKVYLDTQFLQDFTLDKLARWCGLNEFKIKKGFKTLFGTTVFGYLRQLRMDYANRLLLDQRMSVEEVADALGYEHAQHFSTAFKKFTGQNPSQIGRKRGNGL